MAGWIKQDFCHPKAGGQMVITQDLFRGLKAIAPQVGDLKEDTLIDDLIAPPGVVRVSGENHDIEIRDCGQVGVFGKPIRRPSSVRSAEAR